MFLCGAVLCFFSKNEGGEKRLKEMEQRRTDVFPPLQIKNIVSHSGRQSSHFAQEILGIIFFTNAFFGGGLWGKYRRPAKCIDCHPRIRDLRPRILG